MLNRRKSGGAGAAAGPGAEFFNASEASQLNTLLRGEADPGVKPESGAEGGNSQDPGGGDDPTVRARSGCWSSKPTVHAAHRGFPRIRRVDGPHTPRSPVESSSAI